MGGASYIVQLLSIFAFTLKVVVYIVFISEAMMQIFLVELDFIVEMATG